MGFSIKSMTGFGSASFEFADQAYEVEIRTLNHRFLDMSCKVPRAFAALESAIRKETQKRLKRGKIEITLSLRTAGANTSEVFNRTQFDRYRSIYRELKKEFSNPTDMLSQAEIFFLLQSPGVIRNAVEEEENIATEEAVFAAIHAALAGVVDRRSEEGQKLGEEISSHVDGMTSLLEGVASTQIANGAEAKAKLTERLNRLLEPASSIDPQRLAQEVAIIADRSDVTEEIARLRVHIESFRAKLSGAEESIGRELDFLCQEFGREWNTIGSKSSNAGISSIVISAKATLEKIREQVQNIE